MATTRRGLALVSLVCLISVITSADSIRNIPITGTAAKGAIQTTGDFDIQGPGLRLFQGNPQGPNTIGLCTVGTVCDFSFSITSFNSTFCLFCPGYSFGSVGNKVADYLVPSLFFTGSALFTNSGDDIVRSIQLPLTVAGTITGYQLVEDQRRSQRLRFPS
jgi:hypothetical protein